MATWPRKGASRLFIVWTLTTFMACSQTVTVYWTKPGAGPQELERDMEECRSLQRAVGNNENRIDQCLMVKGWSEVQKEISSESSVAP